MISSASSVIFLVMKDLVVFLVGQGRRGSGSQARGSRGTNLRVKLKMNFEEIAKGANKTIKVKKHVKCSNLPGQWCKR